jgi:hypothetical protein
LHAAARAGWSAPPSGAAGVGPYLDPARRCGLFSLVKGLMAGLLTSHSKGWSPRATGGRVGCELTAEAVCGGSARPRGRSHGSAPRRHGPRGPGPAGRTRAARPAAPRGARVGCQKSIVAVGAHGSNECAGRGPVASPRRARWAGPRVRVRSMTPGFGTSRGDGPLRSLLALRRMRKIL